MLALPIFALSLTFLLLRIAEGVRITPYPPPGGLSDSDISALSDLSIMLIWILASLIFLIAGLRDYIGGSDLPDMRRWAKRLSRCVWSGWTVSLPPTP